VQLRPELMVTLVLPAVGSFEMNPNHRKQLEYPSFRDIPFFPIISQTSVLDETDFMIKVILFTLGGQFLH
jgi:hypothetical protein